MVCVQVEMEWILDRQWEASFGPSTLPPTGYRDQGSNNNPLPLAT